MAWKSQPSSGYSTPTQGQGQNNKVATTSCMEDVETADSSVEDNLSHFPNGTTAEIRRKRHLMRRHFNNNRLSKTSTEMRPARPSSRNSGLPRHRRRRSSLPESPFRDSSYGDELNGNDVPRKLITATQVKKALAVKSRRYRRGFFKPLGKPLTPVSTPTTLAIAAARRSHSRSLSDLSGLCPATPRHHSKPALPPSATIKTLRSRKSRTRTLPRVAATQNGNARPQHHTIQRLTSVAASPRPRVLRTDSQDTLKPTSSGSEFSCAHSVASGDPEFEYDLYDYNLDNVVAGQPDSMFAAPLTTFMYDLPTPTNAEEIQMTDLFPPNSPDVVVFRQQNRRRSGNNQEDEQLMLRSRTSDLTASVTSADLGNGNTLVNFSTAPYDVYGGGLQDEEDEEAAETDRLLKKAPNKAKILNLTHIEDDDISYADSCSGDDNSTSTTNTRSLLNRC